MLRQWLLYVQCTELFVTAHVDDILNTDNTFVTVIYNIHKYIFYVVHIGRRNEVLMWLSGS